MLDAPGGGGGTPWESMSLEEMRVLIQNPDVEKHWDLLTGWSQSADLINEHRSQVMNYRANLAAAWPPEKNKAAAAYVARLDEMIDNLSETYEAAVRNHTAFSTATLSISLAQKDVEKIFQEYQGNQQLLLDFTTKQQQQQASGTPTPSPSPSGAEPPVAPGRQEALRLQAVSRLLEVSTDLAQAQARISTPTRYEPAMSLDEKTTTNDGSGFTAPPIPPITPAPGGGSDSSARSNRPPVTFPSNSNLGSSPALPHAPSVIVQQPGLVLGGINPPTLTPSPPTIASPLPSTFPGGTPGSIGAPPILPPGSGNFLPGGGPNIVSPPTTGLGRGAALPREGLLRPGTSGTTGIRAMPPGGVIGSTPGVGLGQPGAARPSARRINPVGGVIGEGETRGTRSGRGFGSTEHAGNYGAQYGQGGSRRASRHDDTDGTHWDPDNPWETAEGVSPVVLPPREQRVDPGPAIGLG